MIPPVTPFSEQDALRWPPSPRASFPAALAAPSSPPPAAAWARSSPATSKTKVEEIAGVRQADIEVVFDPQWDQNMMIEAARLQLGLF